MREFPSIYQSIWSINFIIIHMKYSHSYVNSIADIQYVHGRVCINWIERILPLQINHKNPLSYKQQEYWSHVTDYGCLCLQFAKCSWKFIALYGDGDNSIYIFLSSLHADSTTMYILSVCAKVVFYACETILLCKFFFDQKWEVLAGIVRTFS